MKANCLVKEYADSFIKALKSGAISPDKLLKLDTEGRHKLFSKYVGEENAKWVNTEFESKLLLKKQKEGMISWAKKVGNLKEPARRDIVSRIEKLDKALTPETQEQFLSDIVERRLGVKINAEEAQTIVDLTDKLKQTEKGTSEYGKYKQQLVKFMRENAPYKKVYPISDTLSVLRSIKTGFDLSASLRQGWSYFGTRQWNQAFRNMFGYLKSEANLDELEASMYAHKYSDQAMIVKRDLGLTLLGESFTQREEEFASKLVDKVPLLKGSARAYEGFLNDLRFNRFVDILSIMEKSGNNISDNQEAMKDLAKVIAAASGRGTLGKAEGAANAFATVLFSPRWIMSRIQILTNPITKKGYARVEAAKALARISGLSIAMLGLAKMMGADVEDDPRSSDFGKIKIGNTRFDMTGGMTQYIVLMTRLIKGSTKSSVTGKITELNTGEYGQRTRYDLLVNFLSNKTSPIASAIRDILKGETYEGEPINLDQPPKKLMLEFADNMITPMIIDDTVEAFQNASGNNKIILGTASAIGSIFGISVSSYQYTPMGKKWKQLKNDDEGQYNKALAEFRERFSKELEKEKQEEEFIDAPDVGDESKAEMIDKLRRNIDKSVINGYL